MATKRRESPARPARRKQVRKDRNLNIRCTVEQHEELTAAAAKAGVSTSSWVLALALREARKTDGGGK
jgi:uncharacterized protein (DUF1778 family)